MRSRLDWHFLLVPLLVALPALTLAADLRRGIELYETRKYSAAAAELREVVRADPENVAARCHWGLALLELKEYSQAAEQFKQAEEQRSGSKPRVDQIKAGLAQARMGQEHYDEAQQLVDDALQTNPDSAEALFAQGKLQVHRKDYRAAAATLDRASERDPKNPYVHYYAGIAYSNLRRPDRMVNEFQLFLKLAPDAPEADKVKSLLRSAR
ncbi:MAG: tetratricopeptide repeat protein [Bryobacterales bacterium]|nr:tetratricopeptide repeat protein [Bryobacterales bacterium]